MNHGAAALSIKRRAPSMDANPNIPRSAQPAAAPRGTAGAMSLSWQQVAPGAPLRDEGDDLTVLLPAAGAAVTVSLASRLGGVRRAVVADPAVCIVPPRARLEITAERRSDLLVIAFDGAGWSEQMREALGLAAEIRECKVAATDAFIRRIADLLCNLPPSHDGAGSAWVDALAEDFAIHLATRYGRPAEAPAYAGLSPRRLQRVLEMIDERLGEAIPVRDLAAEVHMSPYHFARMFKQSTGQAPHVYITWQRMDRAKELLARTELPLAEVATRVGYRTQAHFTGVFHSRVGITPRAYRLRCKRVAPRAPRRALAPEACA